MVDYIPDSYMQICLDYLASGGTIHWANACFGFKPKLRFKDGEETIEMVVPEDTMYRLMSEAWIRFRDYEDAHDVYELNPEDARDYYWRRAQSYQDGTWKGFVMENVNGTSNVEGVKE